MTSRRPSLQDIIRQRQRSEFVGREDQVTLFRRNLALHLEIELNPAESWWHYNLALTYHLLAQHDDAQHDLTAAIQIAEQKYNQDPCNWLNTFNLTLFHLAAGTSERAEQLYHEALAAHAALHSVREAIRDLDDFLALFPDHTDAQRMRELLQAYLAQHQEGT